MPAEAGPKLGRGDWWLPN